MSDAVIELSAPDRTQQQSDILSPAALEFLATLCARFGDRRRELLQRRCARQATWDAGDRPDFLPHTASIREGNWCVDPVPQDLRRRLVEITGPVDRKMIINALNSGADVFMADFEDSSAPTWANMIGGQINLRDAVRGIITFTDEARGKHYALHDSPATLVVRPRGWHLEEHHILLSGKPVSASLVDFGLYFFHNARELISKGGGPYFYLPKLESHLEARLWNDVFLCAQELLGIASGSIKATVLIETLPAVFEMDEILYELRQHSAGLNCGRWDYLFSYIKTFRNRSEFVIPDRAQVGMTQHFMRSYTQLLVKTCHRRGAFAMGGMAAQIPIKRDSAAHAAAIAKVRADKQREARDGHDGTWVAHPGLVDVARSAFVDVLGDSPNQLSRLREDVMVRREDLLAVPVGTRTDAGLRHNVRVGIQYLEAWLRGTGCVPLYDLMEDAATAEISRMQIWQWLRHQVTTDDGDVVTAERIESVIKQELEVIRAEVGPERFDAGAYTEASALFTQVATVASEFSDFLTLPAYEQLLIKHSRLIS